ncbi:MAG TPA: hypothetical protein DER33_05475 [Syntrophomonas sp.]|nr:hypothetical protein [Syntrophomonas sp.]HCF71029.1 hypothetical protein [Syntrophomonas sp.]
MIKSLSQHAADILTDVSETEWENEILAYGLEIIIGCLLNLVFIIIAAVWLDTLWSTMLCLISYISFRHLGGGVHLETWTRCLCTGVILMVGLGWIADQALPSLIIKGVFLLAFSLGGWATCKWVPATCKKEIKDEKVRKQQKIRTLQVLGLWLVACVALFYLGYNKFALALSFGVLASSFLITPGGYWVMQTLDNILNLIFKRRVSHV